MLGQFCYSVVGACSTPSPISSLFSSPLPDLSVGPVALVDDVRVPPATAILLLLVILREAQAAK